MAYKSTSTKMDGVTAATKAAIAALVAAAPQGIYLYIY
jgi:hypothetical protein